MTDAPAERLYLVTPQSFDPEAFAPVLTEALAALPVACVRLDLGDAEEDDWRRAANYLIEPCHAADVALIITDHYRLVEPLGLDGVHLTGRASVRDVRKALGKDRIVGAFAGTSRHDGMVLAEAGADYVAFGPVGETGALGDETRAEDDLFTWWAEMIETQSVAEGGVTPEDAARLAEAADFLVPDRRIWDEDDPVAKLKDYASALA
jgi:thiamine-phosphate pyrophosphorylase